MEEANEEKAAKQSSASEEAPAAIVTYKEGRRNGNFQREHYITKYKVK